MDELEVLAVLLNPLPVDPQAPMGYDWFAGGLVWSDEVPAWNFEGLNNGQFPAGHGHFRALLQFRSSLILGTPTERFRELWEKANGLCPNWPGFLPERRAPALAEECRQRADAALASWEEADASFERQRKQSSNKASA